MYLTTKALVLREVKYKDSDKMLTILTESEGKISAKARAALGKSCKYRASTELLCFSEMTLFGNKGRWSLNEAEVLEQFIGLRSDFELFSLGSYFAEILEAVSDEDCPDASIMRLGLNTLFALSRELYPAEHIKSVFELRLMCLSGYEPYLSACAVCCENSPKQPVLDLYEGHLLCAKCRDSVSEDTAWLCDSSLQAMRYIVSCPERKLFSFDIPEDAWRRLNNACESFMLYQLGRGFKTLDYWKKYSNSP